MKRNMGKLLFKEGSMIGLNEKLHNYVEWIANRRMKAIDDPVFDQVARNNRYGLNIG